MALFFQRFRRPVLSSFIAALWVGGCVTAGRSNDETEAPTPFADGGMDRFVVDAGIPTDAVAAADGFSISALCGVGECGGALPDDGNACAEFDSGSTYPSGGGFGGTGGTTSAAGGTGKLDAASDAPSAGDGATTLVEAGHPVVYAYGDASAQKAATTANDAATSFTGGSVGDAQAPADGGGIETEPMYACHVRRGENGPIHRCEIAGEGEQGAPCTSSRDCAPGLGCVEDDGAGKCLHFCCGGGERAASDGGDSACDEGTYCAGRPLRDDAGGDPLIVPVCVPADNCDLDDPYPCTAVDGCTCPEGQACSIVRNDGTTSCVVPGRGLAGEACPCAPGYFCSFASNTCVKICRTDQTSDLSCGTGRCQATVNLPEGYGLCVAVSETR